jgi:hypothetical protein
VSEATRSTAERPTTDRDRPRTRSVRLPHAPERLPDRAGRFLGLLDRSRRDGTRTGAEHSAAF